MPPLIAARTDPIRQRALPEILLVVNTPGWALDIKSGNIQRQLRDKYNIKKRYHADLTAADLERADLVAIYYWQQLTQLPQLEQSFLACRGRLLIGICAHNLMEGAWRARGLEIMNRLALAVFVTNASMHREYASLLRAPVFCTPNGVDTSFYRPRLWPRRTGPLRVGWAGSLGNHGPEQRGFHDLIVPATRLARGVQLVTAIREECWRSQREMRQFYASLDAYVCASRSEGTPNPCLEAAASGVPIVSTPVGNMPEFLRDGSNGFLVERDPKAIARRLAELRDSRWLRIRMSAAARRTARQWDWRHMARHYDALFETSLRLSRDSRLPAAV
jgi:glycosyltransferase involved in cell wall biosynthesis